MNIVKKIVRYSKTIALLYKALDSYVLQPDIRDLDSIYTRFSAGTLGLRESSTLDLGCGAQPKNPFFGYEGVWTRYSGGFIKGGALC